MSDKSGTRPINNAMTRLIDRMHEAVLQASSGPGERLWDVWWELKSNLEDIEAESARSQSRPMNTAIAEVVRRVLAEGHLEILDAPCVFCGYKGAGYWQRGTHGRDCPLYDIGGEIPRADAIQPRTSGTLTKPAQVGNTRFGVGISERTVIERAQREFAEQIARE